MILFLFLLQSWPDELPLFKTGNPVDAGNLNEKNVTFSSEWQIDAPVVIFSFGFCVICLLILVQVGQTCKLAKTYTVMLLKLKRCWLYS
jgi:hypothetical protein